jgi:UDP-N-acetylmuramoyl-L-alanyl-D-glutamate--2,6-diaminopimelate ligase
VGRGAVAIVSDRDGRVRADLCHVRVADARVALALLAAHFHGEPASRLQMIGITGTNGKTTTAYMSRGILRAAGREPGLISTIEYDIQERAIPASRTTPDAPTLQLLLAQMVQAGCRSAVMEVSSHSLDQKRTVGIDYDAAVFTNVTRDHLDYHETVENYFDSKAQLFRDLGRGAKRAVAVINIDDAWGRKLREAGGMTADIVSFGMDPGAAVRAEEIRLTADGTSFRAHTPWGSVEIRLTLMGRFNVSNALGALGACGSLGVSLEVMAGALAQQACVPGRLERIPSTKGIQVFVDFWHFDEDQIAAYANPTSFSMPWELLAAMDIFVLTSLFEGLPRVVLQAMAASVIGGAA